MTTAPPFTTAPSARAQSTSQASTPEAAAEATAGPAPEQLRAALQRLTDPAQLAIELLLVTGHRTVTTAVHTVPISVDLAGELLDQVAASATAAAGAELRAVQAGFSPGPAQWLYGTIPDGTLAGLTRSVRLTHRPYDRDTEFGAANLLVLRVTAIDGSELAQVYQGFSAEKALSRGRRILAFWNGERFASLDAEPLVIDRSLRLFTLGDALVMKSSGAYESLFGPLPDLRRQAAATFDATLGRLPIVGGDQLRAACQNDLNMMRKLISIGQRMSRPGYPEALQISHVLAFLERNPHIDVPVDDSGGAPALVFQPSAQQRWALLKLLDDDFLRSDLTEINYESNSKSEVSH